MRRVYVGRLSHDVRERDIDRFFRSEGKIAEILMKDGFAFVEFEYSQDAEAAVRHLNGRDLNGDRVHVEFAKGPARGRDGVRGPRGMDHHGRNGSDSRSFRNDRGRDRGDHLGSRGNHGGGGGGVSYAEKYGPPRNTDFRVIVENLSSRVSWQDLKDLMRQAGEVTFADAHKRERNVGIVDFASIKDIKNAIETFNDTEFHGRRIKVYEDKSRRQRGGVTSGSGGGRRGGRSRSRSRSRSISRPRSRSRSRSGTKSRSRSPQSRSRSVSKTRSLKHSRSRSKSKSQSPYQSRSRSNSRDERANRSRSRTPTSRDEEKDDAQRSRSASDSPRNVKKERSRSNSKTRSRSRSRSGDRVDDPLKEEV